MHLGLVLPWFFGLNQDHAHLYLSPCLRVFLEAFLKPLDETLFNTFETCRSATNQNNCSLPKASGALKCLIQRFQKRFQKNSQTW